MILSCIFLETEKERPSRRVHSDDQRTSSWGCSAMYPRCCWGTWACNTKRTAEGEYSFGSSHGNHMFLMFSCYVSILTATHPQGVGELLTSLRFLTQWLVIHLGINRWTLCREKKICTQYIWVIWIGSERAQIVRPLCFNLRSVVRDMKDFLNAFDERVIKWFFSYTGWIESIANLSEWSTFANNTALLPSTKRSLQRRLVRDFRREIVLV